MAQKKSTASSKVATKVFKFDRSAFIVLDPVKKKRPAASTVVRLKRASSKKG